MNADPDNFEALRKLLAFKRLEQPPPGYFDRLAGKIVSRLEFGEGASSFWERLAERLTIRPALEYGLVLTLCGTLAAGTVYCFKMGAADTASQVASVDALDSDNPALMGQISPSRVLHAANWLGNTNPVAESGPARSLFKPINLLTVPAAYQVGN